MAVSGVPVSIPFDLISVVLFFIVIALFGVLMMFIKDIKNAYFKKMYKKKGFGLMALVLRSGKVKLLWKKFEREMKADGGTYLFLQDYVVEQNGIQTIFYNENSARPINMKQEKRNSDMCPQLFDYTIEKTKASGSVSKQGQNQMLFYICIAAAIAAAVGTLLIFNVSSDVATIKAMVGVVR